MAERTLFLNDYWLSTLCTPNTDTEQNYFPLVDNSELAASLNDFTACLNATVVTNPPVEFDGWETVIIPTEDSQQWLWAMYHDDIGYFVACGDAFNSASGNAITSPDGLVWTIRATPTADFWWKPIYVPSAGLIIIPTDHDSDRTTNFLTSDDGGASYVEGTTGFSVDHGEVPTLTGIVWVEELGLYFAWGHFGAILSSPDLITWTDGILIGPYWDTTNQIAYSPTLGRVVAVGTFGIFFYSSDGLTWTFNDVGVGFDIFYGGLAWSPTLALFVASPEYHEDYSEKFITSPDGINWTQSPLGIPVTQHVDGQIEFLPAGPIEWDDHTSRFYTLTKGDDNGNFSGQSLVTPSMFLLTSPDGINWTIDTTVPNTHDYSYPIFGTYRYQDFAIKDASNMILVNTAMIIRRIP